VRILTGRADWEISAAKCMGEWDSENNQLGSMTRSSAGGKSGQQPWAKAAKICQRRILKNSRKGGRSAVTGLSLCDPPTSCDGEEDEADLDLDLCIPSESLGTDQNLDPGRYGSATTSLEPRSASTAIVYVWKRQEAEGLAEFLNASGE